MHWALHGLLAFALATVLTAGCRAVANRFHAVAAPRHDRWHRRPVSLLGGVAIFVTVVVSALFLPARTGPMLALLGGGTAIFLLGLADDLRPIRPRTKLAVEIAVALVLVGLGLQLRLTASPLVNGAMTVLWVVGIVNAFNLLDNMDGLAAGVAVIAVGFRTAFFLMDGNVQEARLAAVLMGATAGFLVHNLRPASIFMGDAGSLFVGFGVAGLSLIGEFPYTRGILSVLVVPVLILLVPIFDTVFVAVTRRLAGRAISSGGRDHTSHRLVALGLSEGQAVAVLYVAAVASGVLAVLSYRYGLSRTAVLIVFLCLGLVMAGARLVRAGGLAGPAEAGADPAEPPG